MPGMDTTHRTGPRPVPVCRLRRARGGRRYGGGSPRRRPSSTRRPRPCSRSARRSSTRRPRRSRSGRSRASATPTSRSCSASVALVTAARRGGHRPALAPHGRPWRLVLIVGAGRASPAWRPCCGPPPLPRTSCRRCRRRPSWAPASSPRLVPGSPRPRPRRATADRPPPPPPPRGAESPLDHTAYADGRGGHAGRRSFLVGAAGVTVGAAALGALGQKLARPGRARRRRRPPEAAEHPRPPCRPGSRARSRASAPSAPRSRSSTGSTPPW